MAGKGLGLFNNADGEGLWGERVATGGSYGSGDKVGSVFGRYRSGKRSALFLKTQKILALDGVALPSQVTLVEALLPHFRIPPEGYVCQKSPGGGPQPSPGSASTADVIASHPSRHSPQADKAGAFRSAAEILATRNNETR
jgi:hypothetical protein